MKSKSVFLSNLHYFYAQTDGSYAIPNSAEGDLLKTAKKEIEELMEEKQWLRETLSDEAKNYFDMAQIRLPELLRENEKLREALKEISTEAHCIAKAGPLNTPTLHDAWGKFMAIDAMATKALSK